MSHSKQYRLDLSRGFLLCFSIFSWLRCGWGRRREKGNWISEEAQKRHKIKWHYLKLVFIHLGWYFKSCFCRISRDGSSRNCYVLHWLLDTIRISRRRRRMIPPNPSKRYREMWLKIGGEPRCIFSQFLFQGFKTSLVGRWKVLS